MVDSEFKLGLQYGFFFDNQLGVVTGGIAVFSAAGFGRIEILRNWFACS